MISSILLALLPPFLMIAFGWALRRAPFLDAAFWPQAERLCYFVLLPSLFLHGLATAKLDGVPVFGLAATLIVSILIVAALVVAARPLAAMDGPAFTSLFQGAIRFNNYVGVSVAITLFGAQGVALAALCNAAIVPTVNVLCVLVFARFGAARTSGRGVLRQLALNPLILSCLIGIALHALAIPLPPGVEPVLRAFGAASLPIGLLCVGAALDFSTARRWIMPVAASSAIKFLLLPLVAALVARGFGLTGQALTTALLFQALPTASSAYILARQLGGDAPLMAGITATQTVIAFAAMPAMVALLLAVFG
jgi:predicted permease